MQQRRSACAVCKMAAAVALVLLGSLPIAHAENIRVVGQIGGGCEPIQVAGNYAYVGEGRYLTILDVANPSSPTLRGQLFFPDIVESLFVSGAFAYVGDEGGAFHIVDVSKPASPTLRSSYDTGGTETEGIFVSGSLAYVAARDRGLQI